MFCSASGEDITDGNIIFEMCSCQIHTGSDEKAEQKAGITFGELPIVFKAEKIF